MGKDGHTATSLPRCTLVLMRSFPPKIQHSQSPELYHATDLAIDCLLRASTPNEFAVTRDSWLLFSSFPTYRLNTINHSFVAMAKLEIHNGATYILPYIVQITI
jgi:hypothetical protein